MFRDLRQSVRSLGHWRSGALFAVLTLATGIGAATSLYAFLRASLGTAGALTDPAVARVYMTTPAQPGERTSLSFGASRDLALASLEAVGAYRIEHETIGREPETAPISLGRVSPGFFRALAGRAVSGAAAAGGLSRPRRCRHPEPSTLAAALHGLAGQTSVTVGGITRTVVGVLPPDFGYAFVGIDADL